jgi:TPR repeat protein
MNGDGVSRNVAQAVTWFRRAAEQGHGLGQFNLAQAYRYGRSVPKDPAQALSWYRKAAEGGSSGAQIQLFDILDRGLEVPRDPKEAERWLAKVVERGDPRELNALAYGLAERGARLDQALELIQRALVAEPEKGEFHDTLGWVLYKRGSLETARTHLQKAVSLLPRDQVVAAHLAAVEEKLAGK